MLVSILEMKSSHIYSLMKRTHRPAHPPELPARQNQPSCIHTRRHRCICITSDRQVRRPARQHTRRRAHASCYAEPERDNARPREGRRTSAAAVLHSSERDAVPRTRQVPPVTAISRGHPSASSCPTPPPSLARCCFCLTPSGS